MSTPTTPIDAPGTLLRDVSYPAFMQKLAAAGRSPQDAADAERMLKSAGVLYAAVTGAAAALHAASDNTKQATDALLGVPLPPPPDRTKAAADHLRLPGVRDAALLLVASAPKA